MKRYIASLIVTLFLTGCASHENFVKTYQGWVGQDIRTYIARAGYPDRTYTLPSGHKVYVYEKKEIVSEPIFTPAFGFGSYGYYGGVAAHYYDNVSLESCTLFLETNDKHIIVRWGYRGNACRL